MGSEIQRFPREIQRFPRLAGSKKPSLIERFEMRIARGEIPRGYDKLSKKQKRVARSVAVGEPIGSTCKKYGIAVDTFYRWRRAHPMFRAYMNKCALKSLGDVDARAARQVSRSMRVIDDSLENDDPYFRAEVASRVLRGRGTWKSSTNSQVQQEIAGRLEVDAKVDEHRDISSDEIRLFIDALVAVAGGRPIKTIEVETSPDARKALPANVEGETAPGSPEGQ